MTTLNIGDKAPDFTLNNERGEPTSLKQFRGKKVILYFYPKNNTPGCTAESCNLRDHHDSLTREGYVVIGISPDSVTSHTKFKSKHALPFTLLSDTDHKIADLYGVWGKKSLYGLSFMGILRTTFIINEEGTIEEIISKVKTKDHAAQILKS